MISGSCLCGDVAFEIDESGIVISNNCFCTNCRKVSGAGYGTFLQVEPSCFRWKSEPSKVGAYESSPGNHRAFCPRCGSRAPQQGRHPWVTVPAGVLDADPGVRPEVAFYAGSAAPWCGAEVTGKAYVQGPGPEYARELSWKIRGGEPEVFEAVALTPAQMQEVVGSYGPVVTVTLDEGVLHVRAPGETYELTPVGGDTFVALADNGPFAVDVVRGADGKVAALSALFQTFARDH